MPEQEDQTMGPDGNGANEQSGSEPNAAFPRRRRRMAMGPEDAKPPEDAAAPAAESSPEPAAASPAPAPAPDAPTTAPAPEASSPSTPQQPPAAEATAEPQPARRREAPAAKSAAPADEEEVPPARRAIQVLLFVAIVGGGGWVVLNLEDDSAAQRRRFIQLARGPKAMEKKDRSAGNKLAAELEKQIRQDKYAEVTAQAAALRRKYADNVRVQRVLLKAESVVAVQRLASQLDKLPKPAPEDATMPIADNIARIQKRLELLTMLDGHHRDWREELLRVPAARDVYMRYQAEIRKAPEDLSDWQTGEKEVKQALIDIQRKPPDFKACAARLRAAWGYLPLKQLVRTATDVHHVHQAIYLLDHHIVDKAVEHLKEAQLDDVKMLAKGEKPTTGLQAIRLRLKESWRQAKAKVGAWDELSTALRQSQEAYKSGQVDKAIQVIDQALPKADPDNTLTRELVLKLKKRQKHYIAVRRGWQKAMMVKKTKGLKEQLANWTEFQHLLQEKDVFFSEAFRQELLLIKDEITKRIAHDSAELAKVEQNYTPITLQMRKPQNPRAPFATQAQTLLAMARVAERITATKDLVPKWNLGSKTEGQVDHARDVLSDHNDQARKLNNLYKLYHRLGKLDVARECLERVKILGDVSSNPWYAETVKILEGK